LPTIIKTENDTMDDSDKRLTMTSDNLVDELVLKTMSEDAENDSNIASTTINNIFRSDTPIVITTDNSEEIRLMIDGHSSMV
ncbi:unnamed protein product, partial [Onchocerca ochengi]